MKKYSFFLLPVAMIFFFSNIYKREKNHAPVPEGTARWTGTLTLEQKYTGITGTSERHVSVSFVNALPTLYRDDGISDLNFTDDKGTGSVTYHAEGIINGKRMGKTDCQGSGQSELHAVVIDEEDNTYFIEATGPECIGTNVSFIDNSITPYGPEATSIITSDQPLTNKNVLSGSKTEVADMGGDLGKVTTTITWHLERTTNNNAELIVSPVDYDNWLPEPGRDELTKGTVMKINLKVRGINGQPLNIKAKAFELTLSSTSVEPGITINYPVSPRANQLPDLRFLKLGIGESIEADQFLSIPCHDGTTGQVSIASYDGGGRTILSVMAILKDDTRIRGHLFVSNGEEDIRIPKRDIGSKIATKWLTANGNPGEMDDKDTSNGNPNKGDGLTAYEEYRGIISIDTFRRLSPKKKELGILVKRSDYVHLKDGIQRFQNASDIKVYIFGQNEIPDNRRLNQNALSAHDFNQYVLRLSKGHNRGERDIYGANITAWGVAYPSFGIPARVTHLVIDVDKITTWYQQSAAAIGVRNLPFTAQDLVANTTAHEIGHGVNLPHHGPKIPRLPGLSIESNPPRVFYANVNSIWETTNRPIPIDGPIGLPGNQESGDVSCLMCYRNKSNWVRVAQNNGYDYYQVPFMRVGSLFCVEKKGTGINSNNQYFGNAINGECLANIKLRD